MQAHIASDPESGLDHTIICTPSNLHDVTRGDKTEALGDAD
jgi:hypothetical protein